MRFSDLAYRLSLAAIAIALSAAAGSADDARYEVGGDAYRAGQSVTLSAPVAHDAFAAGYDVAVDGGGDGRRPISPATTSTYAPRWAATSMPSALRSVSPPRWRGT